MKHLVTQSLGLTEEYKKDKNPSKVNLGVGVYYNDEGKYQF